MSHKGFRFIALMTAALMVLASTVWAQAKPSKSPVTDDATAIQPLVTFVELGSVKCIPCRQMQPVMKAIEAKYGKQVNVVFYDVC
jgi:thioredoxin 1